MSINKILSLRSQKKKKKSLAEETVSFFFMNEMKCFHLSEKEPEAQRHQITSLNISLMFNELSKTLIFVKVV